MNGRLLSGWELCMQAYDIFMLIVLGVAVVWGAWKGLAWQIASLASIALSYFVALNFRQPLAGVINASPPWNVFLAMLILFLGTGLVVWVGFNLASEGYNVTQPAGDIIEFNIDIYDTDYFWPLNASAFYATRTWWQSPWGNQMWYNEVRIHANDAHGHHHNIAIASGIQCRGEMREKMWPADGDENVPGVSLYLLQAD